MIIRVSNDIRVEGPTPEVWGWAHRTLEIPNPDYQIALRLGHNVRWMPKSLKLYAEVDNVLILPFGVLKDLWALAKRAVWKPSFAPLRANGLTGANSLYDYQERAVGALLRAKSGVLEAPCGSGKTQMGLELIRRIGGRALWLTHTKKLLDQSKERAESMFQAPEGAYGEITEGKVSIGKSITFATVQTMSKLDPSLYRDEFDIVVVDECHHCVGTPTKARMFYKCLTNVRARYKYGLSATLTRADGMIRTLFAIIGPKEHTIAKEEVGEKTIKAEHIRIDTGIMWPIEDYCTADGMLDYASLITMLSESEERNRLIAEKARELHEQGKKQLILCHRVAQVKALAYMCKEFSAVSAVTGAVKAKDRDYGKASIIVATYALAKEGLDIPDLDVVHLATPQKDEATTRQAVGRVERNIPGKATPMAIDWVDETIPYCVNCYKKRKTALKRG